MCLDHTESPHCSWPDSNVLKIRVSRCTVRNYIFEILNLLMGMSVSNHHKNGKIFVILDENNLEVSKLLFAQKFLVIFFDEND